MSDIQPHNLKALLIGTAEFAFLEGVTAPADAAGKGWLDFGNLRAISLAPDNESVEHKASHRGLKRTDQTVTTSLDLTYELTCDEWDLQKLRLLLYGDAKTGFTQDAAAAVAGDDIALADIEVNKWYDLTVGGAPRRNITLLALTASAALTAGTDYVLDPVMGRVRFLTLPDQDVTPTITAAAITQTDATYLPGIDALKNAKQRGLGRLMVFDREGLRYEHRDFGCEVYVEDSTSIDGDDYSSISVKVKVTTPVGETFTSKLEG